LEPETVQRLAEKERNGGQVIEMAPRSQNGSGKFQQVVKARRKTKRKDCRVKQSKEVERIVQ
jgi:hypothetical protein